MESVVVVDNGSKDASLDGIERFNLPLRLVRNEENKGFAAACNQGAAQSTSEFILFLNPDTQLFEGSLSRPMDFMVDPKNADVGVCGIQLLNETDEISRHCARFPTLASYCVEALGLSRFGPFKKMGVHMRDWGHDETRSVDHVIGAFYLIRRRIFEQLGGFDERFFVYLEDLDLSYRARLSGWGSIYLVGATAFHKGGGTSEQVKAHRLFYSLRSRVLYAFKHFPRLKAWAVFLLTILVEPLSRFLWAILRRSAQEISDTAKGYSMLWADLPRILSVARSFND